MFRIAVPAGMIIEQSIEIQTSVKHEYSKYTYNEFMPSTKWFSFLLVLNLSRYYE